MTELTMVWSVINQTMVWSVINGRYAYRRGFLREETLEEATV